MVEMATINFAVTIDRNFEIWGEDRRISYKMNGRANERESGWKEKNVCWQIENIGSNQIGQITDANLLVM
jgi:hypothetical protein